MPMPRLSPLRSPERADGSRRDSRRACAASASASDAVASLLATDPGLLLRDAAAEAPSAPARAPSDAESDACGVRAGATTRAAGPPGTPRASVPGLRREAALAPCDGLLPPGVERRPGGLASRVAARGPRSLGCSHRTRRIGRGAARLQRGEGQSAMQARSAHGQGARRAAAAPGAVANGPAPQPRGGGQRLPGWGQERPAAAGIAEHTPVAQSRSESVRQLASIAASQSQVSCSHSRPGRGLARGASSLASCTPRLLRRAREELEPAACRARPTTLQRGELLTRWLRSGRFRRAA